MNIKVFCRLFPSWSG